MGDTDCTAGWCCGKTCLREGKYVRDPKMGVCAGCFCFALIASEKRAEGYKAALERIASGGYHAWSDLYDHDTQRGFRAVARLVLREFTPAKRAAKRPKKRKGKKG